MRKMALGTPLFIAALSCLCLGFFKTSTGLNREGNRHYEEKKYESALGAYRKAQVRKPDQPEIRYNTGTTLYQLDQFSEASSQLEHSISSAQSNDLKARAYYNYGNTQYRLGQFDQAIEAYKKTLDLNPNDLDAKYNLELLQKKKRAFEMKQKERDQQPKQKPKPEPNQQNQREQSQQGSGGGSQSQDQGQSGQNNQQQPSQAKDQNDSDQAEGGQQMPKPEEGPEQKQDSQISEQPKEKQDQEKKQQPESKPEEVPVQSAEKQDANQPSSREPNKAYLQGQMSQEDALRILDALRESEQQLQPVLRRPEKQDESEALKDW